MYTFSFITQFKDFGWAEKFSLCISLKWSCALCLWPVLSVSQYYGVGGSPPWQQSLLNIVQWRLFIYVIPKTLCSKDYKATTTAGAHMPTCVNCVNSRHNSTSVCFTWPLLGFRIFYSAKIIFFLRNLQQKYEFPEPKKASPLNCGGSCWDVWTAGWDWKSKSISKFIKVRLWKLERDIKRDMKALMSQRWESCFNPPPPNAHRWEA